MKIPTWAARWFDRVQTWAENLGILWADHWLLILGSLLVTGSTILKWVQFPFSHNLSGLKFSLLRDPGVNPHLTLFSVGAIGLLILFAALILWRRNGALLGLTASVLITLWAIMPEQIAFLQHHRSSRRRDDRALDRREGRQQPVAGKIELGPAAAGKRDIIVDHPAIPIPRGPFKPAAGA